VQESPITNPEVIAASPEAKKKKRSGASRKKASVTKDGQAMPPASLSPDHDEVDVPRTSSPPLAPELAPNPPAKSSTPASAKSATKKPVRRKKRSTPRARTALPSSSADGKRLIHTEAMPARIATISAENVASLPSAPDPVPDSDATHSGLAAALPQVNPLRRLELISPKLASSGVLGVFRSLSGFFAASVRQSSQVDCGAAAATLAQSAITTGSAAYHSGRAAVVWLRRHLRRLGRTDLHLPAAILSVVIIGIATMLAYKQRSTALMAEPEKASLVEVVLPQEEQRQPDRAKQRLHLEEQIKSPEIAVRGSADMRVIDAPIRMNRSCQQQTWPYLAQSCLAPEQEEVPSIVRDPGPVVQPQKQNPQTSDEAAIAGALAAGHNDNDPKEEHVEAQIPGEQSLSEASGSAESEATEAANDRDQRAEARRSDENRNDIQRKPHRRQRDVRLSFAELRADSGERRHAIRHHHYVARRKPDRRFAGAVPQPPVLGSGFFFANLFSAPPPSDSGNADGIFRRVKRR
jgi:hypothetical protein